MFGSYIVVQGLHPNTWKVNISRFRPKIWSFTGAIPLACCNVFFVISFLKYQQKTKD